MDDLFGTRYVTIEAEFEDLMNWIEATKRDGKSYGSNQGIRVMCEILLFRVCSFALTDILQSLLSILDNVEPESYEELSETIEADYYSTLMYDCLAIAFDKNHDNVVRILLESVVWKPTGTMSTYGRCDWSKGCTLLHCAAANGDVEIATMLINYGVDVNQTTSDGQTALHVAYDAAMAEVLLANGADVNVLNKKLESPLYYACASYRLGVIRKLIDNGAKPDLGSLFIPKKITVKWDDDRSIAGVLLQLGLSSKRGRDFRGMETCVMRALRNRKLYGNAKWESMCFSCKNENQPLIEKLLAVTANVDADCKNCCTTKVWPDLPLVTTANVHQYPPLHVAILDNHMKKVETGSADVEMIQLMILSKNDDAAINELNRFGTTALHLAVERNLFEVATLLLDNGADPNLTTSGEYPLVVACRYLSHEFVTLLLDRGADPNVVDSYDKTPLIIAADSFDHRLIRLLVEHGADVNHRDEEGQTALHFIVHYEQPRLCPLSKVDWITSVKYLLDNGFNVNIPGEDLYKSLLHTASWAITYPPGNRHRFARESFRYRVLQLLLEGGADVNLFHDLRGSIEWDRHYVLREMMRHAGNPNMTDPEEENMVSVLMVAILYSDVRASRILLAAGANPSLINWDWLVSTHCQCRLGVCQALLLAGHSVQHQQLNMIMQTTGGRRHKCDLASWLEKDSLSPPSLSRLSRAVVRGQLSAVAGVRTILPLIDVLPLPSVLRMYLRFEGPVAEADLEGCDKRCNCDS